MVRMRLLPALFVLAAVLGACSSGAGDVPAGAEPAEITVDEFTRELDTATRPLVVNLWASWCIPCRSEAPLLRQAHAAHGDTVRFLGIATEDRAVDSVAFIDEFDLPFENRADPEGRIRGHLGAVGLPVTLFVRPGGEILRTHFGVIDDAALALGIDDLLAEG